MSEAAHETLLDRIYGAALDAAQWPSVLEAVADAVGAANGCMTRLNHRDAQGETVLCRVDETVIRTYAEYYHTRNVFTPLDDLGAWRRGWRPMVTATADYMPVEEYLRSEYFNDFMRLQDAGATMHIRLDLDETTSSAIAFGRPIHRGEFDRAMFDTAAVLQPHLIRAYKMAQALTGEFGVSRDLAQALEESQRAIYLVDEDGAVRFANPHGERLLKQSRGLMVLQGRLTATQSQTAKSLQALIGAATARDGPRTGGALSLALPDSRFPLAVRVSPLSGERMPIFGRPRLALVCATDLEMEMRSPEEELRTLFGLTLAEARVASAIFDGLSLPEAAERFDVSINTVRFQLARTFEKTGVTRQADLVKMMMRLAGG